MMGLLKSIGKGVSKVLNVTTIALAHPIKTATAIVSKKSTIKDVETAHFSQSTGKQIKDILLGTAGIAAAVVGGGAIGTAAKAKTLVPTAINAAKSLIPKTAKGKVLAAVTTPIVAGAVVKEPTKSISVIAKAPGELAQFGGDIATFAADPSLSSAKQIVAESPLLSTAAGLVAVGGVAKIAAPIVSGALTRDAIQDQTSALLATSPDNSLVATTPRSPQTPITPETAPLIATAGAKSPSSKRRRTTKPKIQAIKQSVNVIVSNRNSAVGSKKYLKREILAV